MKVILDNIIFSLQKSGGISVYWCEIVTRIFIQKKTSFLFIEEPIKNENIFRKQFEIESDSLLFIKSAFFFSRYRKIDLNLKNTKFIFHSSYYRTLSKKTINNNDVREIVTVHDFTYEYFSSGFKKWIHSTQKRKAIKAADVVICISQNTKKDLLHFFPEFINKKIKVIYNGVSEDYFVIPYLQLEKNTKNPYFVFVGSRVSYKNFDFAVKAVAQLDNFNLKIIGPKLTKEETALVNHFLPNRWEFLMNIENSALNLIYNNAYALLYPSAYEGFGIPLLEAMRAGCPFIALNASSIPEVAGTAGVLLGKLTINDFNDAVDKLNKNYKKIVELGLEQSSLFSWDKCYEEVLNVYKEINN